MQVCGSTASSPNPSSVPRTATSSPVYTPDARSSASHRALVRAWDLVLPFPALYMRRLSTAICKLSFASALLWPAAYDRKGLREFHGDAPTADTTPVTGLTKCANRSYTASAASVCSLPSRETIGARSMPRSGARGTGTASAESPQLGHWGRRET